MTLMHREQWCHCCVFRRAADISPNNCYCSNCSSSGFIMSSLNKRLQLLSLGASALSCQGITTITTTIIIIIISSSSSSSSRSSSGGSKSTSSTSRSRSIVVSS